MMGLEKELKDAAASLQRCNPTAISLKAGCELFLRCALLSVCASERCGIGMLGLPAAQLPLAAAGCCDAAGGRPLHGLPSDACAAPLPVQGPVLPATCAKLSSGMIPRFPGLQVHHPHLLARERHLCGS